MTSRNQGTFPFVETDQRVKGGYKKVQLPVHEEFDFYYHLGQQLFW